MTGSDALLWHMETADTPLHTLKVAVLDPARRGRAVTIDELAIAVGSHLGLVPRATQKVVAVRGFGGRPFWVDDEDFDLARHLDEVTLPAPGGGPELDAVCSSLATERLDRDRSPWALTLVHGLAGGRQAVVLRVHHAITDGLGALNTFLACTTEERGTAVPLAPAGVGAAPTARALRAAARRDLVPHVRAIPRLARDVRRAQKIAKHYRAAHPDLPRLIDTARSSFNQGGSERVCASTSLSLADMRAVGRETGATVNGVLHAVMAGALRAELIARGDDVSQPCAATFGIASDTSDTSRRHGNHVTPTSVALFANLADPRERLAHTARSCKEGVELRRTTGLDITGRLAAYGPRLASTARRLLADRSPRVACHVVTANVAGPRATRWIGDIEVVDWFSFAVAVSPGSVNITVYSYDGRMNVGMVATPAAMPDPHGFLARFADELDALVAATARDVRSA